MARVHTVPQILHFFLYFSFILCCFTGFVSANRELNEDNWKEILEGEWMVELSVFFAIAGFNQFTGNVSYFFFDYLGVNYVTTGANYAYKCAWIPYYHVSLVLFYMKSVSME